MIKTCYLCNQRLRTGDLIEVTVVAVYRELGSKTACCIEQPVDAYANTLRHSNCDDPRNELNGD